MSGPGGSGFRERSDRIDVALAVPVRDGRVLVALRDEGQHQGGLWEFPGGRVRPGETPLEAARRELREEAGLDARHLEPLALVVHDYADRPLRLHVYLAVEPRGEVAVEGGRAWAWKGRSELDGLPMPAANRAILQALRWRL